MTKLFARLPALFLTATLVAACSSEAEPAPSDEAPAAGPAATPAAAGIGTLNGTIAYAGAKTGLMRVAVFREYPPKGPPVAAQAYPSAAFPLAYSLSVPSGSYKIVAFLDVKGDSFQPTEGDPMGVPADANITGEGPFVVDITLE